MDATDNVLMIFLKYPEPGKVKTRLASSIGDEKAAFYYRDFVETIFKNTRSFNYVRHVFFSPKEKAKEIKDWLGEQEVYYEQEGECLGERQLNAFKKTLIEGVKKAVVIGTDNPLVNNEVVNEAMRSLESHDVVIGPSEDGGYYLLGMKKIKEMFFNNVDWSTDKVLDQILQNIGGSGLSVGVLKERFDVDTVDDLNLLKEKYGYER
ncbi:MAG: TIGR04282 family arsenosugar biosynthesis glycosyltransferase [Candidatus Omnitrophica bacterium]|nr:TIGR04282 family arsenosugar biosynthesis glycosyltransferase [Candidatus Omnitrophota bacterium]MBU4334088.1 TIGR04282 family arsenosugar biosynthesis glycosyltransferase [Candidatus Omnitrophota bacterium]